MTNKTDDKKREETKARLRAFLRTGDSDNVQSILVHTLMETADKQAEEQAKNTPKTAKKAPKKPKK